MRVLTVNAGSTSLKLHLVEHGHATSIAEFVDTDEAGAAGVRSGARAYIDGIQSEG